jgi:hypothetical protein
MATEFKLSYTGSEINEKLGKIDSLVAKAVPNCNTSNNGQFLRVVDGVATWSAVPRAEEATF